MILEALASPWIFGSIVSLSALVAFIVYRVGSLQISKGEFSIGSNRQPKLKVSPHSTCPHAKDIMEVIHRTLEYSEKRMELKITLIEDQMRFYEETEEEILGEFKKVFLSLLSDKLDTSDSFVQHPEYTAYVVTLKAIAADLKSFVRTCFKANHYASYTLEEQRSYTEKKKGVIIQKVTEALNLYWRGTLVSRAEVYKANRENLEKYEMFINDIFNRAFLIAREVDKQLQIVEGSYRNYITLTIGEEL